MKKLFLATFFLTLSNFAFGVEQVGEIKIHALTELIECSYNCRIISSDKKEVNIALFLQDNGSVYGRSDLSSMSYYGKRTYKSEIVFRKNKDETRFNSSVGMTRQQYPNEDSNWIGFGGVDFKTNKDGSLPYLQFIGGTRDELTSPGHVIQMRITLLD